MGLKLLGVGGSMRTASQSTRAVALTLELAGGWGAETRMIDLREVNLPLFEPDLEIVCDAVRETAEAVAWADAYLLGTPDYHGSMSGTLKNFLDYHWTEFAGKLFGTLCASHEKGLTAMDQIRTAVRQCYGWSLPYGVSLHSDTDVDAEGQITNPRVQRRLTVLARDLVVYGTLVRRQFEADVAANVDDTFAARYR
jgi:NAD(P)H-dependent FMN reductase